MASAMERRSRRGSRRRPDLVAPRPIILNVGITGHRAGALTAPLVRSLRPAVYTVFRELREATLKLRDSEEDFCSDTDADLRLHTPLATGADQIAAICARSTGYFVRALLPFEPHEYRSDFAPGEELDGFEQALAAADEIVALPGDRSDLEAAYVRVGQSVVDHADVLVAIWDGEDARGPGGTGDVVELALRSGVPVIHVEINGGRAGVRVRALLGKAEESPVHEPDLYAYVVETALKPARRALVLELGGSDEASA
jgi:hypothetical protein